GTVAGIDAEWLSLRPISHCCDFLSRAPLCLATIDWRTPTTSDHRALSGSPSDPLRIHSAYAPVPDAGLQHADRKGNLRHYPCFGPRARRARAVACATARTALTRPSP